MGNLTLFEDKSNLPTVRRQSRLADKIAMGGSLRRIGTNTNGTFKRIVGGEQIGKAVPHSLNVIIVDMLPDVSRTFYAEAYDPDGPASLPDCWSNDGRVPDARAKALQSSACKTCKQNVDGSGNKGRGKACRFRRHIAVLVEGDPSGEVYQLGLAAKSLFGNAVGNAHPFESYCRFLKANGEGPDTVVTNVMYDTDADTLTLKFKAVRHLTQEESDLVDGAVANSETDRYIQLVNTMPSAKTEEAPVAIAPKAKAKPQNVFADAPEEEPAEPVVAQTRKRTEREEPAPRKEKLATVLDQWGDDEDDEG